jgi:thermitase
MSERFYYVGDEQVVLTPSTAYVALQMKPGTDKAAVLDTVSAMDGAQPEEALDLVQFHVILVPTEEGAAESAAEVLEAGPGVEGTMPIFQMPGGNRDEVLILTQNFRVQFKAGVGEEEVKQLNDTNNVEVIAKDDLGPNSYLLRVTSKSKMDALDMANLYHENNLTDYAEPDFAMIVRKLAAPVTDPHYVDQWALPKMRVPEAWGISKGRSSLKIAIIDEGVQISHEDLNAKIVTPYDAVDNDNNQEPNSWDGHGTACAGIAAAVSNNAKGVAGVARECAIMPVRIAYSPKSGADWITSATWIARGIRTAVDRGADVLSNSWGGGSASNAIRDAFAYARTKGRGGKGCVAIAASGNRDVKGVIYPAKYTEVLACGASNEWDQRKSKASKDGENWWGSNYGPELDFVAPGVHIYTTDIMAGGGYGSGNYVNRFNGTSSATPNAAGVAALILSVDPNLRQWEVRDIMRLTAQDLGGSGWDEQHGWGRLNAEKALQAASRVWYEVKMRLEFLGAEQECFMRFQLVRFYNSGLNRVRINGFKIKSLDPAGTVIDQFSLPCMSEIMPPGLAPGGSPPGHDVRAEGILLKANGNHKKYTYNWRIDYGYTYWPPAAPVTSPAGAMEAITFAEQETEVESYFAADSSATGEVGLSVTMDEALIEAAPTGNGVTIIEKDHAVKVTIAIE